jgi:GNAT superfamily N-acetyltransferase
MAAAGEHLINLIGNDPRFCSHGRGIQVANEYDGALDDAVAMARVLGITAIESVPRDKVEETRIEIERHGLKTDVIACYLGDLGSVDRAREVLASRSLPEDLTVRVIDRDSPPEWLEAFAEVALIHGVLPPVGPVMRGLSRPGFAMVAVDGSGAPVATAGSVLCHPASSPHHHRAQWGQLSTHPERLGQGIAKVLGAKALVHSHEVLGATGFKTGIAPGNIPSARLCEGLGLADSGQDIIAVIDPEGYGEDRLTK